MCIFVRDKNSKRFYKRLLSSEAGINKVFRQFEGDEIDCRGMKVQFAEQFGEKTYELLISYYKQMSNVNRNM